MTCIVCGGPIEEGRRHGQPPSEAKYCLKCRAERLRDRRTISKYVWLPEYEQLLRAQYYGGRVRRFRVLNRLTRLTGLPRWYLKRQAARLGLTMHRDRKPWTMNDVDLLERLAGCVSTAAIARRLHRPENSVIAKLKRLRISRRVREGYTMRDLELCVGEGHHKIMQWIAVGWLRDHLQGTRRHAGNGKEANLMRTAARYKVDPTKVTAAVTSELSAKRKRAKGQSAKLQRNSGKVKGAKDRDASSPCAN